MIIHMIMKVVCMVAQIIIISATNLLLKVPLTSLTNN